jgi:hypothetical protein
MRHINPELITHLDGMFHNMLYSVVVWLSNSWLRRLVCRYELDVDKGGDLQLVETTLGTVTFAWENADVPSAVSKFTKISRAELAKWALIQSAIKSAIKMTKIETAEDLICTAIQLGIKQDTIKYMQRDLGVKTVPAHKLLHAIINKHPETFNKEG